jgi:Tfp pilus assembly protein PilV
MRHSRSRQQSGDTIVEVLIAIVVIATVLTGGFLLSRSSLKAVRASEERSQALNLLQGQVEALRTAAGTANTLSGTPNFTTNGTKFCMDAKNQPKTYTVADCGGKGDAGFFDLSIVSQGIPAGDGTGNYLYLATASWPSIDGGTDQIQLYYKVAVL